MGALATLFIASTLGGNVIVGWRQVYSQRIIDQLNEEVVDDALKTTMPGLAGPRGADTGRTLGLIERLPFSLQVLVEGLIWQVTPTIVQLVISLIIIAGLLKPAYVLVLAATLAGFALSTWYGAVRQHAVSARASAAAGQLSVTVADILRNARRVVLNGALDAERRLVRTRFAERAQTFGGMLESQVLMGGLQYSVAGLGLACLLIMGGHDVMVGRVTIGDFLLLQAYAFRLVLPLSGFGFVISQAALALITVRDMLDMGQAEEEEATGGKPSEGAASVVLQDVSFTYGPGLPGLHNINLIIAPASFTVVVGPNGSGKSTLAQLMAGILEPTQGQVLIDDLPLKHIPPAQRYRYLLYVPQTVTLLNRSLLANGIYPPSIQTEIDLARLLATWRFYDPAKEIDFNAPVGELGDRLSGGQRQKLELARLAGAQAPVIILDESTSALDPTSEVEIVQTLREGYGNQTTLVLITHRIGLVERADRVLFMKNGTLLRAGKHEDLLRDSAAYGRLWQATRK